MDVLVNTFSDWLLKELEVREWSQSDLARRAGVSNASISDVLSGRRNVGHELARSIAKGLDIPTDQVFRAAGMLPPEKEVSSEIKQIVHLLEGMTKDEQQEYLAYLRFMNNRKKK